MSVHIPFRKKPAAKTSGAWTAAIDRAILAAETAELELSRQGQYVPSLQRKASGSYYTPSDVAAHFWDLFFRFHHISDLSSLLAFIGATDFVEPAAGSGMFIFSFLKKAASLGATARNLASLRFHVIDINLAALRFFSEQLHRIEEVVETSFTGIGMLQNDFLEWKNSSRIEKVVFVGNPPFIANPRGTKWKNLYADFVEAMLLYPSSKGLSLILPLSVSFSRDYAELRRVIASAGMGVSASSYDNIPDCLFKAGKPDSDNTNKANSQRCTILNLGGPNPRLREASALLNWPTSERNSILSSIPIFRAFDDDRTEQIPRPASDSLVRYLDGARNCRPLGDFLSGRGRPAFVVGGVARNFIGIRDFEKHGPGTIPIRPSSDEDRAIALQLLSSRLFFDYWRTYGDGFHVTVDLIDRFPLTDDLLLKYKRSAARANVIWERRSIYAKEKRNCGKIVRSYDFSSIFI
jgi:hypothetical protein